MSVMLIRLCLGGIPSSVSAYLNGTISELLSPLSGADEDGSGNTSGSGSEEDDSDEGDDEEDDEGEETAQPANAEEAKKLAVKNGKLRKNNRKLLGQIEALQKEKDTAANAGKDETERLRGEVQTLTSKLEEREQQLQQGALKQAFLESNKIQWHDAKTAFKLLDVSEVDIDEDGDTSGMDDAIKALAEQHPYLVKSSKDDKEKDGKSKESKAKGSSGEGGKKSAKGTKDGIDREALRKKYPALQ